MFRPQTLARIAARLAAVTALALAIALPEAAAAAQKRAALYLGNAVPIGRGTARVVVRTDPAGSVASIAIELTPTALDGLPAQPNKHTSEGQWEYVLPMPDKGPKTGFAHVVVDWNPHGHPPPKIYSVPHFDFHFYTVGGDDVTQIAFTGPSDPAAAVSDARLVPKGYRVVPDTVVDKMGVHALDLGSPEFHGNPFTATFVYGYYKGKLIFVEPMVARSFLLTKPSFAADVPVPAAYSHSAYYPSRYSVRYEPSRRAYVIELGGLKWEDGLR